MLLPFPSNSLVFVSFLCCHSHTFNSEVQVSLLKRKREGHREGTTDISRLQFMQAAVDSQLEVRLW